MTNCLYRTCPGCGGAGIQNVIISGTGENPIWGDITCPQCSGDTLILWGDIVGTDLEGISDILDANYNDNLFATYKIMEATIASEYNALSDANKDAYRQIVSCGVIDLSDGTTIRTKLWNMFDENSDTRANLIVLLGE